ncbi:hypothetical protein D3C80_2147620 [compost metagenome]
MVHKAPPPMTLLWGVRSFSCGRNVAFHGNFAEASTAACEAVEAIMVEQVPDVNNWTG